MFKSLKEKLKNWTKKISGKTETVEEIPSQGKATGIVKKGEIKDKESEKELKEVPIPTKFEPGLQSYVPDTDKIKEIEESLNKKEEPEPGEKGFLKKVAEKISKVKISEKEFEVYAEDLEMLLLENNVALEVAEEIIGKLKTEIIGKEFLKKEAEEEIKDLLKDIIKEILIDPFDIVKKIKEKKNEPYIILFCGINGTGKTTSIAKIAEQLKGKGISTVLAAGDTFRAASIEQLKEHGKRVGVKVISHDYGTDPASVGFDAIKYAKKNRIDCVLIDTAGRMHTAKNLLKEIEKIVKVCKPDLKLFVGESITGNDAVEQAKSFNWSIGIDGIILTKADIDEKGGTSLSVSYITKKPILYLGTGQEYGAIEIFDKEKFIKRLGL